MGTRRGHLIQFISSLITELHLPFDFWLIFRELGGAICSHKGPMYALTKIRRLSNCTAKRELVVVPSWVRGSQDAGGSGWVQGE